MRSTLCLLFAALLILTACQKQTPQLSGPEKPQENTSTNTPTAAVEPPASETNDPSAPPSTPEVPLPPPPPPSPVVKTRAVDTVRQNVVGEVDAQLTEELRNFIQQKKRMPQTFSEFATVRLDSIPRPPAGKRWIIDSETIEVKAVAAQ